MNSAEKNTRDGSQQREPHPCAPEVLVAEDNALLALDVVDLLATLGVEVLGPVASRLKAMAMLDKSHASAAVLDWNLADGTADVIARRLEAEGVPFVFYTSEPETVRALWPDRPVIRKPGSVLELLAAIEKIITKLRDESARTLGSHAA